MRSPLPGSVARARASLLRIQRARGLFGKWPATKAELQAATALVGLSMREIGEKPSARMSRLQRTAELRAARAARAGWRSTK